MRFLFITDILDLDDPMKGYFHRWLEEFAKHTKDIHCA